jgi:hypothetical protein
MTTTSLRKAVVIKRILIGVGWFCVLVVPSILALSMLIGFVVGILHYGKPGVAVTQSTSAAVAIAGVLLALLLSVAGTTLGKLPGTKPKPRSERHLSPPQKASAEILPRLPPPADPSQPYLMIFRGYKVGESPAAVQERLVKIYPHAANLLVGVPACLQGACDRAHRGRRARQPMQQHHRAFLAGRLGCPCRGHAQGYRTGCQQGMPHCQVCSLPGSIRRLYEHCLIVEATQPIHSVCQAPGNRIRPHSTVTDFARLRGLSTSVPRCTAAW